MKKIISLGAAFLFVLSAGMTSYAGHHAPCMTRVIQGSGLCWYGESHSGRHHLFGHDGWTDCGACGVDVGAVCDGWESCHEGYGAGTVYSGQGTGAVPEGQSSVGQVPESQPMTEQAAGNQAQTESGTGAAGTETNGAGTGYQNYNGACYGGGGNCYSGSYTTGHHSSGHHGHGHH